MSFLELKDIHKSYTLSSQIFPVLKGVNLSFERGEFVSILGESGAGKSTLMNIIAGLDHDYQGDVVLDGKSTRGFKEKSWDAYRRQTIGFIFQSFNLISHLTVLDNILISLEMTTLTHAERDKRARELLTQLGLKDHIKKHPNQLSGGQKQRVAIARALASDPDIIIADEPTGALDAKTTSEILDILQTIAQSGKLVIAVTHSQDVASFSTRVVHISDGVIDHDESQKPSYPVPEKNEQLISKPLSPFASYKNAYKHLLHNFWRNFLIMLGTGIGIFSVLVFLGLGNGINGFIQNQINSMVNPNSITVVKNPKGTKLSGQQDYQEAMTTFQGDSSKMLIDDSLIAKLKKLKNVDKVEPGYSMSGYALSYNGINIQGQELQTWTKAYKTDLIKAGRKSLKHNDIIIDKTQAEKFFPDNYKKIIGQTIIVTINTFNAEGLPTQITANLKVSGIASGGQGGALAITSYQTMKDILESNHALADANFVSVNVKNAEKVKNVASAINRIKKGDKYQLYGITVGNILDTVNNYVQVAAIALASIAGISLIVSALMIIVAMYMSVSERTKEIGVLRALGEGKSDIRRLFTSESLLIG
ncbi:MAG: ATP-binding cassette domain-containing protein, partial [Streptococcaceae bacterium]|nr:ATP-binding cassette domain-containing protein [Streptococcaceae bacterium]